jgi:cell division transport system permease protein
MAERQPREGRLRAGRDPLGLRRALADRLLAALVAAMALLAALTLAGVGAAEALSDRWRSGAAAAVTVQIPPGDRERMDRALAALRAMPEVRDAARVDEDRMRDLLRPWLGEAGGLPLPGVIELRLVSEDVDPVLVGDRLAAVVPGALVEAHGVWVARLSALAEALHGVALAVLALVAAVAAAVVGVATRAGLSARRDPVIVLHSLGATDGAIAGRFAGRAAMLAAGGALVGAAAAVPALLWLADLGGPLLGGGAGQPLGDLPWPGLAALPAAAALIGWATAQVTVRLWLRRLP